MIDEIKSKVALYKECMSVMECKVDSTCFEDYEAVEKLHSRTLRMWIILDQWKEMKASLLIQPFL